MAKEDKIKISFQNLQNKISNDYHADGAIGAKVLIPKYWSLSVNRILFETFGEEQLTIHSLLVEKYEVDLKDLKMFISDLKEIPGFNYAHEVINNILLPLFVHNFPSQLGSLILDYCDRVNFVNTALDMAEKNHINCFPEDDNLDDILSQFHYSIQKSKWLPASRLVEIMLPMMKEYEERYIDISTINS